MFKKIEKKDIIMLICFMLVIFYTIFTSLKHSDYLDRDFGFTIGKTIKYKFQDGFKDCIEYNYYVGNVKFVECVTVDDKVKSPLNKFYKVKYSKIKPEISEMYLSKEIKDSAKIMNSGFEFKK